MPRKFREYLRDVSRANLRIHSSTVKRVMSFYRNEDEAEVADSVQQPVELSLVEQVSHELGLTRSRYHRHTRKGRVESFAQAPLDGDAVSPRWHSAPPGVGLLCSNIPPSWVSGHHPERPHPG